VFLKRSVILLKLVHQLHLMTLHSVQLGRRRHKLSLRGQKEQMQDYIDFCFPIHQAFLILICYTLYLTPQKSYMAGSRLHGDYSGGPQRPIHRPGN
jgi:hypothetical protein